jgi:Fe-S-cluster containining protein
VSRYHELAGKVDAFFARVADRHGSDMQCSSGCSDCCHVRLTITSAEAAAIRAELATWPAERLAALVDNARAAAADRCAALDANGRCLVYAARPFVCRSHGAPIRMREGSLPIVKNCFRNFRTVEPDPDCILDQTTLSALALAVDRESGGDGSRIDLADLLANC